MDSCYICKDDPIVCVEYKDGMASKNKEARCAVCAGKLYASDSIKIIDEHFENNHSKLQLALKLRNNGHNVPDYLEEALEEAYRGFGAVS